MKWMRLYNYYTCSHWLVHISLERCSVMSWVWSRCSQGKDSNCNPADQALCALCPPSQCTSGEFPRFSVIISLSSLAVSLLQVSPPVELKHKLLIIIVYYILLYNIIYIYIARWYSSNALTICRKMVILPSIEHEIALRIEGNAVLCVPQEQSLGVLMACWWHADGMLMVY